MRIGRESEREREKINRNLCRHILQLNIILLLFPTSPLGSSLSLLLLQIRIAHSPMHTAIIVVMLVSGSCIHITINNKVLYSMPYTHSKILPRELMCDMFWYASTQCAHTRTATAKKMMEKRVATKHTSVQNHLVLFTQIFVSFDENTKLDLLIVYVLRPICHATPYNVYTLDMLLLYISVVQPLTLCTRWCVQPSVEQRIHQCIIAKYIYTALHQLTAFAPLIPRICALLRAAAVRMRGVKKCNILNVLSVEWMVLLER